MNGKLRGSTTVAIALFLASSMFASMLGIRQFDRVTTESAWVVSGDLSPGQIITANLLKRERINKSDSSDSIQNPAVAIGKRLTVQKSAGDTLKASELVTLQKLSLAHAVPEGRVLYTLDQPRNSIPYSQLRGGERLDVVVRGRKAVRTVARDVQVIGVVRPDTNPKSAPDKGLSTLLSPNSAAAGPGMPAASLVLAVRPVDVYPLASIAGGEKVSLVLHSAHDIDNGNPQYVGPTVTHRDIEIVSGLQRQKVRIRI